MQLSPPWHARVASFAGRRCATPAAVRRLVALLGGLLLAGLARPAHADGRLAMRGYYYKEKATRVMQPMLDGEFEIGDDGQLTTHALIDAITSASSGSGADGSAFTERRMEAGLGYEQGVGNYRVRGTARLSSEPDYKSLFAGLGGQVEFAQKNTALAVYGGVGSDDITNAGAQGGMGTPVSGELTTLLGSVSLGQVLSPLLVAGLTYDVSHLDGLLENPYRSVIAGGARIAERVPDIRWRHALYASARRFVPSLNTTLIGGYRFYVDNWGVIAHTPELRAVIELSEDIHTHLHGRFYRQGAADFYKSIYDSNDPAVEPYLTDDPKLSRFSSQLIGAKLSVAAHALGFRGPWQSARGDVTVEYLHQNNRFGDAVILQAAVILPFSY